jgi:Uma2 family endonuclease
MTVGTLMTADELLRLPDDGWRYELVKGELKKMSPSGAQHGLVSTNIIFSLAGHVKARRLGSVYASEAGFIIARNPDTVRAPDAAFVRTERAVDTAGFFVGPPDAAFEVVSPGDSYSEVEEKTGEWLRAGVLAVVIVDPRRKTVRVHRATGTTNVDDVLAIDDVIPGWRASLAEIFE